MYLFVIIVFVKNTTQIWRRVPFIDTTNMQWMNTMLLNVGGDNLNKNKKSKLAIYMVNKKLHKLYTKWTARNTNCGTIERQSDDCKFQIVKHNTYCIYKSEIIIMSSVAFCRFYVVKISAVKARLANVAKSLLLLSVPDRRLLFKEWLFYWWARPSLRFHSIQFSIEIELAFKSNTQVHSKVSTKRPAALLRGFSIVLPATVG